jgi:hypothetical protein
MNKNKSEYDQIKGMLNTLRNLNESKNTTNKLLREDINTGEEPSLDSSKEQFDNVEVINDVEVKILSTDQEDIKLKDQEKTSISQFIDVFRQQVSQLADLDPGITIDENQIRLDGNMTETEISFTFIAGEDSGLYINSDMLNIEQETLDMLAKLLKFKPTFITTMEPLLRVRRTS